ncbi:glycosyltransferase family 4 protein [uncultured Bacteroides sp.]|uniref:glycosyltransferase family 4 protein n=1 Tax=uncultured Bacteroides sp. TaxID=162156 RepID=UPI0025F5727E|nr:glycosyltransferase family 4 protein [uncultured Bacteroides sp.]
MINIHFVLEMGTYPQLTGGMEIFNYYLIKSLKDKFNISYSAYKPLDIEGIRFMRCLKLKPTKFLFPFQLFFYLLFNRNVKRIVFSYSAAHWIVWYLYTWMCRLLKRKYYVVIHYGDTAPNKRNNIYRNFFQYASAVIAVSNDIKKNYDLKYNLNCKVIYPLVPFKYSEYEKEELRKKYGIPLKSRVICMIGSLKKMKNPDTVIKALTLFSDTENALYNPFVVYAGDGQLLGELRSMVANFHLEEHVLFLGNIPKETINEIYKLSDIYLIASDFEGTSVALLEAMFNRKVIITSRVPGIVDTINENTECLMFQTRCEKKLKEQIITLLSNSQLCVNLSENAYNHYCYEYNYNDVLSSYTSLLSK